MGVFEDLQDKLHTEKIARMGDIERITAQVRSLHQQSAQTLDVVTRVATEHAAIGRRLSIVEDSSDHVQAAAIEATSRRVAAFEDVLSQQHTESQAQDAETQQRIVQLQQEIEQTREAILSAMGIAMEAQRVASERLGVDRDVRLKQLEGWYWREQAWAVQPWWKRWWRRIKGERP